MKVNPSGRWAELPTVKAEPLWSPPVREEVSWGSGWKPAETAEPL